MGKEIPRHDYLFLMQFLREHLGHDLGEGKEYLLEGRLGPLAASLGLADVSTLIHRLRRGKDQPLGEAVLEAMITGETSFFRTTKMFDRLRRLAIPALMGARASSRRLRIWCAACSTGQEPYSVAMTLADHFPTLRSWSVDLLATDTSERLLQRAREGLYSPAEVHRGLPKPALRKHFTPVGDRWQVAADLRRSIRFRKFNLLHTFTELGARFDMIFMCNILIYLDGTTKSHILARLREVIEPDGYLFLGESETILGLTEHFTVTQGDDPFYRPAASP
ncbi:MAG TPA: protein-glutamate O-methyltransferase CheR [Isosphaeraceae bacterium]|jgi:chemotaxis protein methyltransferase CheR|nr:protein-glutamate O-methyltransferase CheR [Isosphaeraceae bacterium]